jgi:hypothetical protein
MEIAVADIYVSLKGAKLLSDRYKGRRYSQLTRGEKNYISKMANEYSSVLRNRANFVIRKVSKENQKALKNQGFKVSNSRVVIRSDHDGAVKIKRVKNDIEVTMEDKYETKITTKYKLKSLVDGGGVPRAIYATEEKFGPRDEWAASLAGKPVGPAFQSIDDLLLWLQTPTGSSDVYNKLGAEGDADKLTLMRVTNVTRNRDLVDTRSRGKQIKDANKYAKKWRR